MDSGMDLSALISSVLQNPEITNIISSISNGKKDEENPPKSTPVEDPASLSIPPEILAKLPQMMSALSGMSEKPDSSSGKNTQRSALLKALRPYLSERRRSVIDGMIGMEGVARVLGTLKDT